MEIWKYVTYALIVGYLRLQTHARGTYCCSRLHNLWIRVGCLLSHFPALFADIKWYAYFCIQVSTQLLMELLHCRNTPVEHSFMIHRPIFSLYYWLLRQERCLLCLSLIFTWHGLSLTRQAKQWKLQTHLHYHLSLPWAVFHLRSGLLYHVKWSLFVLTLH